MKKFFVTSLIATFFAMCGAGTAVAASWRVNSNTAMSADFADVNAAMSDERVVAGDTLYIDPGTKISTTQNITKRVTIVGPGYLHQGTPIQSAVFNCVVYIKEAAAGTKIEGCVIESTTFVYGANSILERNYIKYEVYLRASNVTVHANYIEYNSTNVAISGGKDYIGTVITNNIIKVTDNSNAISTLYNATVSNNVIVYSDYIDYRMIKSVYNSVITNNIFIDTYSASRAYFSLSLSNNNVIENNVTSCSADDTNWADYPNNTFLGGNDLTAIFDTTGIADRYYRLCENSPAKGAGVNGSDCGAYAGDSYVPSGLPLFYPYFTRVEIPSVTTDGKLNIKLNIKTQNE